MTDNNMNLNNTPEQELEAEQLEQVNGGDTVRLRNDRNILGGARLHEIISGGSTPVSPVNVAGIYSDGTPPVSPVNIAGIYSDGTPEAPATGPKPKTTKGNYGGIY